MEPVRSTRTTPSTERVTVSCEKSMDCQFGDGGAVDEAAVHLEVGERGEAVGGGGVDEGGLELFEDGVAGGYGGEDFGAGVGRGARWEVGGEEEGYLGFEAAVAVGGADEGGGAGGHPGAGHGREEGCGFGGGGADLPAADLAEGEGDLGVDAGGFFEVGGLEVGGEIGDGGVGAAGVDEEVGGFDELLFAGGGDHG